MVYIWSSTSREMELAGCNSILTLLCLQQYDTISVRLPTNAKALLLFIDSPIWDSAGGCTICVADVRYPQYILEDNMEGKCNKREESEEKLVHSVGKSDWLSFFLVSEQFEGAIINRLFR